MAADPSFPQQREPSVVPELSSPRKREPGDVPGPDESSVDAAPGRHPFFPPDEYATRVERLRARLRAAGVAIALFDEIEAMTWLAGFGNTENRWRCVGIPVDGDAFYLIRALDATPCRQRSWIADVPTFRDWEDPFALLRLTLQRRGLASARIGLDFGSYGMPLSRFERLKAALPQAEFVDVGNVVWELRLFKSPREIELLTRAARVADEAMQRAAAACVRGATQRDAARAAASTFIDMGADPSHPGPISAGRGWDFLHGHLGEAPLSGGDVVHIELTPRMYGYSARIMRCAVVGAPSTALQRAADTLRELQDAQIDAMWPGAIAGEVDAILRDGILAARLRDAYDNISGYTLGFYHQAGPRTSDFTRIFHPGASWILEPGMVFHMYASAAGASYSETVHVTEHGPRRLTRLPRTLIVNP